MWLIHPNYRTTESTGEVVPQRVEYIIPTFEVIKQNLIKPSHTLSKFKALSDLISDNPGYRIHVLPTESEVRKAAEYRLGPVQFGGHEIHGVKDWAIQNFPDLSNIKTTHLFDELMTEANPVTLKFVTSGVDLTKKKTGCNFFHDEWNRACGPFEFLPLLERRAERRGINSPARLRMLAKRLHAIPTHTLFTNTIAYKSIWSGMTQADRKIMRKIVAAKAIPHQTKNTSKVLRRLENKGFVHHCVDEHWHPTRKGRFLVNWVKENQQ